MKSHYLLKLAVKLIVSFGIIYWLVLKGHLDFAKTSLLLNYPYHFLFASLLFLIQIYFALLRWREILKSKSKNIPKNFKMFSIQWIGQFFSAAIPGAIAGDVVKVLYVKKVETNFSKRFLFFSVLFDRILGIVSLLLISGIATSFYFSDLAQMGDEINRFVIINFALLFFGILLLVLFLLPRQVFISIGDKVGSKKVLRLINSFIDIKPSLMQILRMLILSMISQFLGFIAFYIINQNHFQSDISFKQLAMILPLGQISLAIPLFPSGFGIGHFAFQEMFSLIGHSNGANLFNNFWLLCLIINLLGFIPYLLLKKNNELKSD